MVTEISFGLIAVAIGFATGHGVMRLSGGKRHLNLQLISVAISIVGFAYATYLVNRTFIVRAFAEEGQEAIVPWVPGLELFYNVVAAGFGIMNFVFLAIVIWEAWKIPAPVQIATGSQDG